MTNRKIKICHIAHRLTGKSDGVFTHLKMLFKLLDKNQFEQILMYSGNEEIINSTVETFGVKVYNIPELNDKIPIRLFFKLLRILKEENVDIIHTHLVKPYIFAGLLNLFLKKKLIFNYHGIFINSDFYNSFEKIILNLFHKLILNLKLVDIWIFPSKLLQEKVTNEISYNSLSEFYYNGYEIYKNNSAEFDKYFIEQLNQIKSKYFLIGVIGRVDHYKRIDIALTILKKLIELKINAFVAVVGDGDLLDKMKIEANRLGIADRVKFFGFVSDVGNYFIYFDLILITSEAEGFPMVIWEAMYNGVPVVSSDVGGIKEILESENCGIVYPFGDVEKCAGIITDLYYNREKLKQMGENGKKAILERYNEKQFKKFFEKLYTDLVYEK